MISAASALSGFDLPASHSKNRSQFQKCVLRVFLRVSASPRQEASLNPHPIPSHANIKYSSFPLTPSTQTTYPPHHPPPPPDSTHPSRTMEPGGQPSDRGWTGKRAIRGPLFRFIAA